MIYRSLNAKTWKTASLILICFCAFSKAIAQPRSTFQDTRNLLLKVDNVKNDSETLAVLFKIGDGRINDLLKALNDPNAEVSLRAQIVIRYLGNELGMAGLFDWYSSNSPFRVAGPVPLPLREWDYNVIAKQFLTGSDRDWIRAEPYVYALALDDSPAAKQVLRKLIMASTNLSEVAVARVAIEQVEENPPASLPRSEKKALAKLARDNAFFIPLSDRKHASEKLLSYNGAGDKALIELRVNRGVLSEEVYHVVLAKVANGWKFFSITQTSIS